MMWVFYQNGSIYGVGENLRGVKGNYGSVREGKGK
jgi:hypothetical protein